MTVSVGHAVLAAPGIGDYRREDVICITDTGCEVLTRGDALPGIV
jgi:Xaa-Pro aminopeptidase